jgi:hypothetical protein
MVSKKLEFDNEVCEQIWKTSNFAVDLLLTFKWEKQQLTLEGIAFLG